MYEYIRGTLVEVAPSHAIIETGDAIGWKLFIPFSNFSRMPALKEPVCLYTSFVIRENSQSLYGFLTRSERDLFEQLLAISGVGPKTALSLVGHLEYNQLITSIRTQDTNSLCKVPGIGKKTAERIVLEIKDKLPIVTLDANNAHVVVRHDAVRALIHLGYGDALAQKAVTNVLKKQEEIDLSALITLALKECK